MYARSAVESETPVGVTLRQSGARRKGTSRVSTMAVSHRPKQLSQAGVEQSYVVVRDDMGELTVKMNC